MIPLKAYILVETKKNYCCWLSQNPSQMGFKLSKTTFNLNVFSKLFDFRALGVHKSFVSDEHIFVTRSYLINKVGKGKVSDGHIIFGVGRTSFLDKLRSTVNSLTFIFNEV